MQLLMMMLIVVKLRIWTMDQHQYLLQFNTGSRTTAGQILTEMIHELGLPADCAGDYFSIWLTSPHLREWPPSWMNTCDVYYYRAAIETSSLPLSTVQEVEGVSNTLHNLWFWPNTFWYNLCNHGNNLYSVICLDEPILSFQRNAFLKLKDERKVGSISLTD